MPASDPPLDVVSFHAQQAAEKALKALLTERGIPFPKIHDLEEIEVLLPESDRRAPGLDPDDLALLSQLAVAPRYPGWAEDMDEPTARRAANAATAIVDRVRGIVGGVT